MLSRKLRKNNSKVILGQVQLIMSLFIGKKVQAPFLTKIILFTWKKMYSHICPVDCVALHLLNGFGCHAKVSITSSREGGSWREREGRRCVVPSPETLNHCSNDFRGNEVKLGQMKTCWCGLGITPAHLGRIEHFTITGPLGPGVLLCASKGKAGPTSLLPKFPCPLSIKEIRHML